MSRILEVLTDQIATFCWYCLVGTTIPGREWEGWLTREHHARYDRGEMKGEVAQCASRRNNAVAVPLCKTGCTVATYP